MEMWKKTGGKVCGNGWIDRSTQSKWKSNYQKMDFCEECQNVKKSLKRNKPDVQKIDKM